MTTVCPYCQRPFGDIDAPGTTGREHPETSKWAGASVQAGSQRHDVLRVLRAGNGWTADDVAQRLDMSPNQAAARILELRRGGYVTRRLQDHGWTQSPVLRPTRTGRMAHVHGLTPAGRQLLLTLDREETP